METPTLKIKPEFAEKANQILKAAFGPDAFTTEEQTPPMPAYIYTWRDVETINGIKELPKFSDILSDHEYHLANWQWEQIVKAYNKLRDPNFKVDWLNDDQYKYWPYAILKPDKSKPTGFAFSFTLCHYTHTETYVGSRLCFAHEDDVLDALKKFEQIYIRTRLY